MIGTDNTITYQELNVLTNEQLDELRTAIDDLLVERDAEEPRDARSLAGSALRALDEVMNDEGDDNKFHAARFVIEQLGGLESTIERAEVSRRPEGK